MFSCSGTELAANISAVFDEQFTEEKVEAEVSNDDCHLLQTKLSLIFRGEPSFCNAVHLFVNYLVNFILISARKVNYFKPKLETTLSDLFYNFFFLLFIISLTLFFLFIISLTLFFVIYY